MPILENYYENEENSKACSEDYSDSHQQEEHKEERKKAIEIEIKMQNEEEIRLLDMRVEVFKELIDKQEKNNDSS